MFGFRKRGETKQPSARERRCSFCNKSQRFVKKLVAGPNVYICDECVDICVDIVNHAPTEALLPLVASAHACSLCNIAVDATESLPIGARGLLCPGCVGEIEASLEERKRLSSRA
jgi:hypothetical protein